MAKTSKGGTLYITGAVRSDASSEPQPGERVVWTTVELTSIEQELKSLLEQAPHNLRERYSALSKNSHHVYLIGPWPPNQPPKQASSPTAMICPHCHKSIP